MPGCHFRIFGVLQMTVWPFIDFQPLGHLVHDVMHAFAVPPPRTQGDAPRAEKELRHGRDRRHGLLIRIPHEKGRKARLNPGETSRQFTWCVEREQINLAPTVRLRVNQFGPLAARLRLDMV